MMYRVEFNETGYYSGQGVWICLDETAEVEAATAQEAIELCIDWMIEQGKDYNPDDKSDEEIETEIKSYAWRASEIIEDEYGKDYGTHWEFKEV